jgi:hypothetical protein
MDEDETPSPRRHPPDAISVSRIFSEYGATMAAVQFFETTLATLVIAIEADPETPSARWSDEQRARNIWHLLQRATASEMKQRLRGRFEPRFLEQIAALITWRDFLAHRYLRVRLFPESLTKPVADPSLIAELRDIRSAFREATNLCVKKVKERAPEIAAQPDARAQQLAHALVAPQPPRFPG